MKHSSEYEAFASVANRVLSISREEMIRRESAYKAKSDANPKKRGPKRKPKHASPDPAEAPLA